MGGALDVFMMIDMVFMMGNARSREYSMLRNLGLDTSIFIGLSIRNHLLWLDKSIKHRFFQNFENAAAC